MRRLAAFGVLLAALAVVMAGCSPRKALLPDVPPETTLFVQFDPADTVTHTVPSHVHLYWLGQDPDGYVVAYEFRFVDPARPADTAWVRTQRTDSLFDVPSPTGLTSARFEVRAIDDQGVVDPTPASQSFSFSNQAPTISITNKLLPRDTSYAAVTVQWNAVDPDGDAGRLTIRVWLNGEEANAALVPYRPSYTVPSAAFLQEGHYRSNYRRLFVQAIDPGGRASLVDSMTWFVRQPCPDSTRARGRLLLIDDVPSTASPVIDSLWRKACIRNLPAGSFSILQLETTQPFRSAEDMRQTFDLFDAVFWYRGLLGATFVSTLIRDYQYDGIGAYLDGGGTVLLEGLSLAAVPPTTSGALELDFVRRYLASDSLYSHAISTGDPFAGDWSATNGTILNSTLYASVLRFIQGPSGLRAFAVRDTHDVALWARAGQLTKSTFDLPVGVRALQPAGGQAIVLALPLRSADGINPGDGAAQFLDRVMAQLPPPRPTPPALRIRREVRR